ncbi:DUF3857 domain-containing protein [Sphingomonas sp. M1-B02]|uniref:DUF3857 domain-containing protein n=1 Tax=Sphingomonas sp. M1-B02 TaxID=3114300 RepID=UPI00223F7E3D|nr:DUF3857 domain-containing protein [Sphingomonas sp. S6-11]UZK65991.1 DUF3857 domain-containing protein [Sphingomonas sp. S6-11]
MIFRSLLAVAAFCVAGSAWPGSAKAGDKPLYQPRPAWVAVAPDPALATLTDSSPALVIFDQQQRIGDGQVWAYADRATRVISSQTMREIGTVALPWQPDAGDLIIHSAKILRAGGDVDLIAAGQRFEVLRREEQLEQWQLNGTLTATMAVEGLRVGDVLRIAYSITSKDKALQGNVQTQLPLIAEPMRAGFARARLSWPAGIDLKWRAYPDGLSPKAERKAGYDEIDVTLPLAKPAELPADAPARYRKPQLLEATSFADWAAVSRVMAPLYASDGLITPGSPLAAEVAKIAAKSSDPRTRAAMALRLVQDEVRYLFRGMDGGNYIPQSPASTWSLRYGDCKAKTLLLLAILGALKIEAEPVLASLEMGDLVAQRLPSPGAFDHVIVRAVIQGKSLWLDGTGNGAREGDLDDTPPFRNVLPVRAEGAALMPIVMRAPARPMAEAEIELDQSAGLAVPAPFKIVLTVRGALAEVYHAGASQANKEQMSELGQALVSQMLGDAMSVARSVTYDAEAATATVTVHGVVGSRWKVEQGRYRTVFDKTLSELEFAPDRARPAWKDIPVMSAPRAFSTILRLRSKLPRNGAGFEFEGDRTLPPRLAGATITRTTALANGWATLEDRIAIDASEIAPGDVAAVRAQVALAKSRPLKIVAPADYPPRWKVVADAKRTNAFAPLFAAYAAAIADDPEEVVGYTNRASFLNGIWDWKGAVADLDKAIALAPTAALHFWRARMRTMLRDDSGAIADAEAGLTLEPGSTEGIGQLATLRFRAGQRDAALASIAERIAQGGTEKLAFVSQQGSLLAEAGRGEEAIAVLDAAIKTNPGNATLLNERCWLKGTMNLALDTALKDCTKGIELAENPSSIYDSRAMVYFRMGRMEEALADLDAALDLAPAQDASLYLRGVVRKRMGNKAADEDLAAARMMSARIDEDYARYGIKP